MLRSIWRSACLSFFVVSCGSASAQISPTDSLKSLHPAAGMEVSLWASEPMVRNPTAMEIDSRGRVWIAEGLNYRMKQKEFDSMSRVADADQIKILSDTNGDGKADQVTVFADNIFPVPLGLAVEEIWKDGVQTGTRVYTGNSPNLLVLEDTDGDDIADRRHTLLTGFRGVDSDHGLHGMTFGPDGKLYFTVGDARYGADKLKTGEPTLDVMDQSGQRVTSSNVGTTLRVNRDGTQLKILSSGHRNNYEAAVDSFGNVFGSDNDDDGDRGCRMYWVLEGGEYGYQHPDSPRHWAEELPGIIPKLVGTGNGSPSGLVVYEGSLLPEQYHGAVLQIDAGTHQVNSHPLVRHGAGFRSDYDVLLKGDDDWFRPVDVSVATDGSLFVCDWYDAGVGGNRFSDQTTGRIYRVSAENTKPNTLTFHGDNAAEALQSPNAVARLAARDQLVRQGAGARDELLELLQDTNPVIRARALHVLHGLPTTGQADVAEALHDPDPRIRETSLSLLSESDRDNESNQNLDRILALVDDPDAGVRRALLLAISNQPTEDIGAALQSLTAAWDGRDRFYLEALRVALIHREPEFITRLFSSLAETAIQAGWDEQPIAVPPFYPVGSNDAFLRPQDALPPSNSASRVIGLAWVLQRSEALPAMEQLLSHNQSPSVEQAASLALAGIADPAAGRVLVQRFFADGVTAEGKLEIIRQLGRKLATDWRELTKDDSLSQVFMNALDSPAFQITAIESIANASLVGFEAPLMKLAGDDTQQDVVRVAALTSLGKMKHQPVRALAAKLIDDAQGSPSGGRLALAALETIHSMADDTAQPTLLHALLDENMPLDARRRSLQLIATSFQGANTVLSLQKQTKIAADLESELSFLLHNHSDRRIRLAAEEQLPVKAGSDSAKIHNVQAVLAMQGNVERGRELFANHKDAACARCHRVTGEGALVGPDLASVGMKYGDRELLYHIQYPSGAINYNFVATTFLLEDGRVQNGLVLDRRDGKITLGIATGQQITIDEADIEEERPQSVSLMPEGLVANFTEQQLSDLIEYLLTLRQGDAVQ
ncbi:putative transmembrane protein [Rhodopirellula islandica]|uniref:Transmembrane protein n=1 Tax=Rhodopirellula islandica TaxID=595434 RepID=A0A0J1BM60_RHOIS|nr:PVC-type heme-binding CxxCH protein [Rhodopirellula islandica]KLU07570.1 putative transmembrane protein [Rhodopirellula islandica]